MPLNGDLEHFSLTSLLQLLASESMSGALHVRRGREEILVHLEDGEVTFASDERRIHRVTRLIHLWEAAPEGPLETCKERARVEGRLLEELLEDGGYLLPKTQKRLARETARETLYDLFLLDRGAFEFEDSVAEVPLCVTTRIGVMEILMEGARLRDETEDLAAGLPDEATVLRIAGKMKENRQIQIEPDQWRLLSFIDGRRSLRQVVHQSGFCHYDAFRLLRVLLDEELVEPAEGMREHAAATHTAGPGRCAGQNRRSILVVDDMIQIRTILKFNLTNEGYRVTAAQDGEEALGHLMEGKRFDLVLLDVMMPKMDGYELIRRLRRDERTRNVPVIFLTARAQKTDILKGIEAGADDYVVKPYRFNTLKEKIERLLPA